MTVYKYRDTWGGKNYGCYPISTLGSNLIDRLNRSSLWKKVEHNTSVDEKNDNQSDIIRGGDFVYLHKDGEKNICVIMSRSRSGKTVNWEFNCNFSDPIEF